MRRLWIGVILLTVMLAGGISVLLLSHRFYDDFSASLTSAANAAQAENWSEAEVFTQQATDHWLRYRRFLASFTDHEPVEDVEILLSRLALFLRARLVVDFADTCENLSHLGEAIDEAHNLHWWSIL